MKKNNQESGIIHHLGLLLLVVVLLAVVGFAGWRVMQNDKSKNSQQTSETTETVASTLKPYSEVLSETKSLLAADSQLIQYTPNKGEEVAYINFKHPDYAFRTNLNKADSQLIFWLKDSKYNKYLDKLSASGYSAIAESDGFTGQKADQDVISAAASKVEDLLKNAAFKKLSDNKLVITAEHETAYMSTNDVCLLFADTSISLVCAAKSDFASEAVTVKPYVEVYEKAATDEFPSNPNGVSENTYGIIESGIGTTENDKYVVISIGNAAAYLYEEDGEWKYYTSSQEGISCKVDYPSDTAKAAFSKVCNPNDYL